MTARFPWIKVDNPRWIKKSGSFAACVPRQSSHYPRGFGPETRGIESKGSPNPKTLKFPIMARRNDHSREEIREMALAAAENLLDREGTAGLSARKIAGEIGYAVGSLYLVFQNLDDLCIQVNARTLGNLGEQLDRVVSRDDEILARILALGRTYLDFAARHPGRWDLIFGHPPIAGTELPDWYRRQVGTLFDRVEVLLASFAPERSPMDRALAARALWSGVHGVCTLALGGKLDIAGIAEAEKLTESLIRNYLSGWSAA